jgi:hypothetical protein
VLYYYSYSYSKVVCLPFRPNWRVMSVRTNILSPDVFQYFFGVESWKSNESLSSVPWLDAPPSYAFSVTAVVRLITALLRLY